MEWMIIVIFNVFQESNTKMYLTQLLQFLHQINSKFQNKQRHNETERIVLKSKSHCANMMVRIVVKATGAAMARKMTEEC